MTEHNPYEGLKQDTLIVRDHLALDRTRLANERTLLAYLRSGVALLLAGSSFIYFADKSWFQWIGLVCLPLGASTLLFGIWRFLTVKRRLRKLGH